MKMDLVRTGIRMSSAARERHGFEDSLGRKIGYIGFRLTFRRAELRASGKSRTSNVEDSQAVCRINHSRQDGTEVVLVTSTQGGGVDQLTAPPEGVSSSWLQYGVSVLLLRRSATCYRISTGSGPRG